MPNVSVGLGGKQYNPDANSERQPMEYRACDECDNSMGYVDCFGEAGAILDYEKKTRARCA
jgi:hypothetical protein